VPGRVGSRVIVSDPVPSLACAILHQFQIGELLVIGTLAVCLIQLCEHAAPRDKILQLLFWIGTISTVFVGTEGLDALRPCCS